MARALATHAMRARPSSALVSSCLLSLLVACARRGAGGSRRPWRHRGSRRSPRPRRRRLRLQAASVRPAPQRRQLAV